MVEHLTHRMRTTPPAQKPSYADPVRCHRVWKLFAAVAVAACAASPIASADSGSPSYDAGKQSIDNLVNVHHVQFPSDTDWPTYCEQVRTNALRTGQILHIDSPADFVAGCQDEGRALASSR